MEKKTEMTTKEKIRKFLKKVRRNRRKRKLFKQAEQDALMLCGKYFHMLPAEIYIDGDKETMLEETLRIRREFTGIDDDVWPLDPEDDEEEKDEDDI